MRYFQWFARNSVGSDGTCPDSQDVSRAQRIELLEQAVREYSQLIQTFEADRMNLLARAASTERAEAVPLADALAENQRALELLARALAIIKTRLEEARSANDPKQACE